MSSPLTNDFDDILDVAKTMSKMLNTSVSIYPHVRVESGKVEIDKCHLCAFLDVQCSNFESQLLTAGFTHENSRLDEKINDLSGLAEKTVWEEWGRESFRISIGRTII